MFMKENAKELCLTIKSKTRVTRRERNGVTSTTTTSSVVIPLMKGKRSAILKRKRSLTLKRKRGPVLNR